MGRWNEISLGLLAAKIMDNAVGKVRIINQHPQEASFGKGRSVDYLSLASTGYSA